MPVSEERLYRPDRINLWFAISSVLMTASILWLIYVDYARPWHQHQDEFFVGKAAFAHLDYLDAIREGRVKQIELARARRDNAAELMTKEYGPRLASLREQLAEADLEFKKANGPWSSATQLLDVTRDHYEKVLAAHGSNHAITQAVHRRYREDEEHVEALRKEKERWEDKKKQIETEIKGVERGVRDAEKELRELEQLAVAALQKDQQFRGVLTDEGILGKLPLVRWVINMPLLDFTAPKNTPGRYQVNQVVLPDVRQQLNYLESYTTDRCTTCHVSIGDPEYSKDRLAKKLERSLPAVNEALQRMGEQPPGLPTPPVIEGADVPLPAGGVTDHWDELTRAQQDTYFDTLLGQVNHYFKLSGRKTISLGQPLLAHPDLDLYVTTDSPHPLTKMGCTVCHEGNPQETDFVLAAHSPGTHQLREDWKDKYYVTRLGVPNMTFDTMDHFWDRPMRLPHHTEAGCAKCHSQVADISRFEGEAKGQKINLGRHLFTSTGCVNCHTMDDIKDARRVGPDLSRVAAKLRPEFVQPWAFFPQKFRPSTPMPHLFLQENNGEGSENEFDPSPVLRTETEVAAISQYLFAVSKEWKPIPRPEGVTGDVERGRELFKTAGCLGCHANLTEYGETWITEDLMHRERIDRETATHRYKGMTYVERSKYAMTHFSRETDSIFDGDRVRFDPERKYNPPVFSRVGPELSGIGSKVTAEWLFSWVSDPTHYSIDTKMPNLRLSPAEAADLTAYLMTLKHEAFEQKTFELNPGRLAMADQLVFELLAAQRSEARSDAILKDERGELTKMLVDLIGPSMGLPEPSLTGEAAKSPAKGNPELGKQKAYDIVQGMSLEEKKLTYLGNKMISHYGCYACHKINGFEETTPPGTNLTTWAQKPISQLDFAFYDHAFHDMRHEKEEIFGHVYPKEAKELNDWSPGENGEEQITHTHAAFAKHKMLNPRIWDREKIKRPYDKLKMPNFYFSEQEADALTTYLLSRVSPRVNESLKIDYEVDELGPIARGRNLTRELNCVGCHQFEENAPTIQQYYRREIGGRLWFDETNAPPLLWGEGAKVQHQWLHRFLQHVETLRPWLQVRMPTFKLTGDQATTLTEYFAALARHDSHKLSAKLAPVEEFREKERSCAADPNVEASKTAPGSDWYKRPLLDVHAANLRRFAVDRKLMRPHELDLLRTPPDRFAEAHGKLLDRVEFIQRLYDVAYPFVEPAKPVSPPERFALGQQFFSAMGCLNCHVFGNMLPGPAKTTDDFVQMYRLDGVRGEGDKAVAMLNGVPYPVGSVVDGHKLLVASNKYYENGDIETKAYFEGANAQGAQERIMLQAASAPNLALTHQRLRRAWVFSWMLEPQLIQPGTKMPQNFPQGVSPYKDDPKYPGTGEDHIQLLVDYLYDAGVTGTRSPMPKLTPPAEGEDFEEGAAEEFED